MFIASYLNNIRIWPEGIHGIWKRFRYQLRRIVSSSWFENTMLITVLMNTFTLSFEHYGIQQEVQDLLDKFNHYFTIIFIIEMGIKLLAIGPVKYC